MNKENIKIFEQGIEILKRLHFKPENIVLTGSMALELQGVLPDNRTVNDLDFLIEMDNETWKCLKLIGEIYTDTDGNYEKSKDRVDFEIQGIKFSIWRSMGVKNFRLIDEKTGVRIFPVNSILAWKKYFGRIKDFKDIQDICKELL